MFQNETYAYFVIPNYIIYILLYCTLQYWTAPLILNNKFIFKNRMAPHGTDESRIYNTGLVWKFFLVNQMGTDVTDQLANM